ncbi:dihydrolipoamide acetyltransferase family protein [Mesobacillus selenatarsenatis]|uniref:Dihydrolipoamide acetyltransferase component of pyruvate dehydrogenase complex n=1 Tax=Mesobacillus selenatarsenatis (strain DSM 18680 / JCM 14380 / FERM P-15431 / SF-1) TaxID=1321606 RepID=A0A0A8X7D3_MESS1|nr:dihydrolipoamide acetyltransferase family protein [Mesobacillus selenatarsenatis]GAM14907.1 dihydrolipoamide acyltransferase component of branched-chain alpha-keto acid dehydrogenase complex [Mesobacillus selenatarsenatis SF-1]
MVEVKLHDIGEGMTEADINCYLVKPGDFVKADDPLVEVQTDKMTAEIPAPRSGVIKELLLTPGQTVKVGTTLLIIEESSGGVQTSESQKVADVVKTEAKPEETAVAVLDRPAGVKVPVGVSARLGQILASPYTRKVARENAVNIMEVKGTGPAGRITEEDILAFVKLREHGVSSTSEAGSEQEIPNISQPASEQEVPNVSKPASEPKAPKVSEVGSEERAPTENKLSHQDILPFRGRRKQIAKKMVQSMYTIPHCTHFEEIDVSELIALREEIKGSGSSISATAFFIKVLSIALKEFPIFNAKLDEENENIQLLREHHIGIAVDTPEGLIVPVIRNVEQMNLKQIHDEMKRLTKLALDDKLTVKDISGGTFTISNVGPLGGSIGATPIIQHPQTALVSFHKTKKRPVVTDQDEIAIRSIMNLSMAFDHRVADGATAVAYTNRFAQLIENPKMMLLELM